MGAATEVQAFSEIILTRHLTDAIDALYLPPLVAPALLNQTHFVRLAYLPVLGGQSKAGGIFLPQYCP